jgi:hypothetical protein
MMLLSITIPPVITNRIAALVLLAMIYVAGYDSGKQQAVKAHHNHPACHQNLKP